MAEGFSQRRKGEEISSAMCCRIHAHCCLLLKRSVELLQALLSRQGINRPQVEEEGEETLDGVGGGEGKRLNR